MKTTLNFKSVKMLAICLTALLVAGCDAENEMTDKVDAGLFISSTEIATSWNDSVRSTVKTTKGVFTVKGIVSAMNDEAVTLQIYSNGSRYLCTQLAATCKRIL